MHIILSSTIMSADVYVCYNNFISYMVVWCKLLKKCLLTSTIVITEFSYYCQKYIKEPVLSFLAFELIK